MDNIIYLFLDIDGVLNSENYVIKRYEIHHKAMHMNAVPFDPKCLYNLMLLYQILTLMNFNVKIILSSTWRLHDVDYEIVDSRLAEYGMHLEGKTPYFENDRGIEIQHFLKDKQFKNIIILDDDDFDINKYYKHNLIKVNRVCGLTKQNVYRAINKLLGGDYMSTWNNEMVSKEMDVDQAIDIVDEMYQERTSIIEKDNCINVGLLNDIKFTNLEFASVRLLREVQSLQSKLDSSIPVSDVQNLLNSLSTYFKDTTDATRSEIQVYVLSKIIDLINTRS